MDAAATAANRPAQLSQKTILKGLLYALLTLLIGGILAFNIFRPIVVLPRITLAPGYALQNQAGDLATSEDRRGELTLYSFSYADCGDVCPQTAVSLATLQQQLNETLPAGIDLDLLTISVNPTQDTPEALHHFAAPVAVENGRVDWQLLTGDPLPVKYVIGGGFDLYYPEPDAAGHVQYQPRFVLVDGLGMIRATYHTAQPDPDLIARDVNYILEEIENSDGLAKLGYEAAHLFLCYPR